MVVLVNYFDQVQNLEPHCPGCNNVVKFGLTTEYKEKAKTQVCITCGHKF